MWSWWYSPLLQVLRWHQADHLGQWPGDELSSCWTVQGERSHSSEPQSLDKYRSRHWLTCLCFRTTLESSTTWWHCTSCTSTSTNTTTRCVYTLWCNAISWQNIKIKCITISMFACSECLCLHSFLWNIKSLNFCLDIWEDRFVQGGRVGFFFTHGVFFFWVWHPRW